MRTWNDTVYELDACTTMAVVEHEGQVALTVPGYGAGSSGRGFTVWFSPAHHEKLRELTAHLEKIEQAQEVETKERDR